MKNPHFLKLLPLAILALTLVGTACAQSAASQERVATDESTRRSVIDQASSYLFWNSSSSDYAPASPGDSDLGEQLLLTRKERYKPFRIYAELNEYWTNNAGLTQSNMLSDWLMVPQFGLNYTPQLTSNLFGDFSVRQQLFRYASNTQLNFNSTDMDAGLIYVVRQLGDLAVFGRYHFTLLTDPEMSTSTYNQQTMKFGVQKPFILSRAHMVYVGSSAEVNIAGWPSYALKNNFDIFAGYQASLTRNINASLYYRIALFNYTQGGRDDLNQNIGMGLSWIINDWFSINTVASFAFNSSNTQNNSYWAFMAGSGVSGQIKF
ncbi:MAG: hypothetical protein ABI615_06785 [Chthoniobacterales bacterium]